MASPSQSKVCFFFDGVRFTLSNRVLLKRFITGVFKKEGKRLLGLNYIFCSDERLREINRDFLGHDYYTDIVTFDMSDDSCAGIQGEVYISIDRVRENARQLGQTIKEEIHRVIFHGALHLCGYKDKTQKEQSRMREKEDFYLKAYARFHVKQK